MLVILLTLVPTRVVAVDVTDLPGLLRTPLSLHVTEPDGSARVLEALTIRPGGPGPYPLVLITHGMPRPPTPVTSMRPESYSSPAIAFAQRGFASVIVMRSGYGHSAGPFSETLGPCADRNHLKAGQAAAADVLGALDQLRHLPWIDPSRVLLLGHSMGGFAVLAAAAQNPPGVLGTISFAGGVGSPRANFVCQPDRLIAADHVFGQTTRIPSLWIFARNDGYFGPDLAQRMFDAYAPGGQPATLFMAPDFGHEGHTLVFAPPDATWWPHVAAFLNSLGLPTQISVPLPPPTLLPDPVPLDAAGGKAFATYVPSRGYEKAFATDPDGHYGVAFSQRTITDAEQAALQDCQRLGRICNVYAAGNTLKKSSSTPALSAP